MQSSVERHRRPVRNALEKSCKTPSFDSMSVEEANRVLDDWRWDGCSIQTDKFAWCIRGDEEAMSAWEVIFQREFPHR